MPRLFGMQHISVNASMFMISGFMWEEYGGNWFYLERNHNVSMMRIATDDFAIFKYLRGLGT
jgi:hypothetical protein